MHTRVKSCVMCLLKHVPNCEQHFSYFDPDYPTSRFTVTGLVWVYFIIIIIIIIIVIIIIIIIIIIISCSLCNWLSSC
jgi:uncharacterized membrane protein